MRRPGLEEAHPSSPALPGAASPLLRGSPRAWRVWYFWRWAPTMTEWGIKPLTSGQETTKTPLFAAATLKDRESDTSLRAAKNDNTQGHAAFLLLTSHPPCSGGHQPLPTRNGNGVQPVYVPGSQHSSVELMPIQYSLGDRLPLAVVSASDIRLHSSDPNFTRREKSCQSMV